MLVDSAHQRRRDARTDLTLERLAILRGIGCFSSSRLS